MKHPTKTTEKLAELIDQIEQIREELTAIQRGLERMEPSASGDESKKE